MLLVKKNWGLDDITLLDFAVEALGIEHLRQRKAAVVEQTDLLRINELGLTQSALSSSKPQATPMRGASPSSCMSVCAS